MKKLIKLILLIISPVVALFSGCVVTDVVSLYMAVVDDIVVSGKAKDSIDDSAIKGIRAILLSPDGVNITNFTQSDGSFYLSKRPGSTNNYTAQFDDIDGTNNGQYQSSNIDINVDNIPFQTNITIELDKTQ